MATLSPVFVGWTEDSEKIILYERMGHQGDIHIQLPSGEVVPLSPEAKIKLQFNWEYMSETDKTWVSIKSPEWTGEATGTRQDLVDADAI